MLAAADTREIENLVARYAELVDTGDLSRHLRLSA
jgi:hypothetical protein